MIAQKQAVSENIAAKRDFLHNFLSVHFCWSKMLTRDGDSFSKSVITCRHPLTLSTCIPLSSHFQLLKNYPNSLCSSFEPTLLSPWKTFLTCHSQLYLPLRIPQDSGFSPQNILLKSLSVLPKLSCFSLSICSIDIH